MAANNAKGIQFDQFSVSEHTVNQVTATIERIWARCIDAAERKWDTTLTWISGNPIQFIAILIFLGWWLYQRRAERISLQAMKQEYQDRRDKIRKR